MQNLLRCSPTLFAIALLFLFDVRAEEPKSDGQKNPIPAKAQPAAKSNDKTNRGQPPAQADKDSPTESGVLAGHSFHGEAFNEGPRQKAYLMEGTGTVSFPVTTENPLVQKFVNQGVGQLHGYWFFEAERSFRQAAMLDPNCAIAYWGMAIANRGNSKRARGFIAEAVKRKSKASPREAMYIDAMNQFFTSKASRKEKAKQLDAALDKIIKQHPEDLEAKAFWAYNLYRYRSVLKRTHEQVEAALKKVLAIDPMHPAHHFLIHLWDAKDAKRALASSAKCGQAASAIAHMWHMPGHIYARLKRHDDAAWQQEASARVDHAHMMRDRVMPDQIHNFAHNNEWLIRSLIYVGRSRDAVDLAKNMIELPRHPKYNTLRRRGSAYFGRLRLFSILSQFELWDELILAANGPHLEPTDVQAEQIKRLRHLGVAYACKGDLKSGQGVLAKLNQRLAKAKEAAKKKEAAAKKAAAQKAAAKAAARKEAAKKAAAAKKKEAKKQTAKKQTAKKQTAKKQTAKKQTAKKQTAKKQSASKKDAKTPKKEAASKQGAKPPKKTIKKRPKPSPRKDAVVQSIERAIAAIEGYLASAQADYKKSLGLLRKARVDQLDLAKVQLLSGDVKGAVRAAESYMRSRKQRTLPLARYVELMWLAKKYKEAGDAFDELLEISGSIQFGSPVFERLTPIAKELGLPQDWRLRLPPVKDLGQRPPLDSLGPFRWRPMPAAHWVLKDAADKPLALKQYRGKPVVVIFYLGYACLHCVEQLQAFAPMAKRYRDAGIELIAVSTDDATGLKKSLDNYEGGMPFPLVSNTELDVFKAYRAFDDFEDIPLHGTYLIDENGLIRWQDVSYEPFMNPEFLLKESKRLLAQKVSVEGKKEEE